LEKFRYLTDSSEKTSSGSLYYEAILMPWGLRWIFYISTLVMLFGIVGPLIWTDDDISGWVIWVYYPSMAIGAIGMGFASYWFRTLIVWVDDSYVAFGYGRFRKRFSFDQISDVKTEKYDFVKYGGAGIRFARGGFRAWSIPFMYTCVEISVTESGKERTYYVSSRNPSELEQAIARRLEPVS